MKFLVEFQFELESFLTQEEIETTLTLIEDWSENQKGAFLEIPGGFKQIILKRKVVENKN